MRSLGFILKSYTKDTSCEIDLYKFLVLHVILSAGNDLIMMAQAKGNCDRVLLTTSKKCKTKHCVRDCKWQYGFSATGFCYTVQKRNDTCVCRYPC